MPELGDTRCVKKFAIYKRLPEGITLFFKPYIQRQQWRVRAGRAGDWEGWTNIGNFTEHSAMIDVLQNPNPSYTPPSVARRYIKIKA